VASIIFAAGKGSRMRHFEGNKTLLPLIPDDSPFRGNQLFLTNILEHLPPGPKAVVVHQPVLDGTGGALLAAKSFIRDTPPDSVIITMGDIPLVKKSTYADLVKGLEKSRFMVLGFQPEDKKQYGLLDVDGDVVRKIVEWKYWKSYSGPDQARLRICNSGIYAARRPDLLKYIDILEIKPHTVMKERDGKLVEIKEYFITDIIELMVRDGLHVGYTIAPDENEVMGVDDLSSLKKAQAIYTKERSIPWPKNP